MLVWDTLRRSHLSHSKAEFTENSLSCHVDFVLLKLLISETLLRQFQLETKNNHILQTLITYTTHEWSERHLIPKGLHSYYTHHSNIIFCAGILLENGQIIYPLPFQENWNPLSTRVNHYVQVTKVQKHKLIIMLVTNEQWYWRHDEEISHFLNHSKLPT